MSGLVFTLRLDGRPPDLDAARAMAAAAPHRSGAAVRERTLEGAVAVHLDGGQDHIARTSPLLGGDGRLLLVADARLDNRRELALRLGRHELADRYDDPALLLAALERWGDEAPEHLLGDFAFVAWDAHRGRLLAARDPLGMRPLYYRVERDRVLLASEVAQLLAVAGVPHDPNEGALVAYLVGSAGLQGWTAYAGIRRLPAGQRLVVDASGVQVTPYWQPSVPADRAGRPEEYAERLRDTLAEAVRGRLEVASTPGLLLSGGLDSTSIAGVAGMRAEGRAARLRTYSFVYDDLPECDERAVSDQVASAAGLPNTWVPVDALWPLATYPEDGTDLDGPDLLRSYLSLRAGAACARGDGVTVLLSGQHGDQLAGSGITDYLGRLRSAGPLALWRDIEAHARRTGHSRRVIFEHYVLRRLPGAVWPHYRVPALRRRLRARVQTSGLPTWLRPKAAREHRLADVLARAAAPSTLPGEARRRRHEMIADPQIARNAETLERRFMHHGLRYADPWSDRRLVDLVLETPQYLLTPAGEPKRLVRDAMRGVLPEEARVAAAKPTPAAHYNRGLLERGTASVWGLIEGSRAAERGYVDGAALRETYTRLLARDPAAAHLAGGLWRYLTVEDWLRRYHE